MHPLMTAAPGDPRFYEQLAVAACVVAAGDGACWPFTGELDTGGYGAPRVHGKRVRAHRVAWEAINGEVPAGLVVCHRCDHPSCCNPAHLFIGTQRENMHDRDAKGRGVRPARRGKLNPLQQG